MHATQTPGPAPMSRRAHDMPVGATVLKRGIRFRVWAPAQESMRVVLADRDPQLMKRLEGGWHELVAPDARAGHRYWLMLGDGSTIPDPASRYQPQDVHGPSEVIDPRAYEWRASHWRGRPWEEAVVYELHVGTFTREGTFRSVIDKLPHLVELGVTAIELMPVADFPGGRNWGYDGVFPFAPDSSYGRPEDLKALVDAAHERGLMVLLDVVYNHFGPEGNYFPVLAPQIFTARHHTPWGAAVNYDGAGSEVVRELIIHNALYWIEEFNLDGLRLDAVHAIIDESARHLLADLAERVRAATPGRSIHLLLENERNEVHLLERAASVEPTHYTAQWNDDVHHVLHTAATGEGSGYYRDYLGNTERLARALAEGFAFQGERMEFTGHPRGARSAHLPPTAFVAFIQNHDQIGNRAFGERLDALTDPAAANALAAVYLLLPQVPMLFMGEEWGARQPFQFFCEFGGELAESVRQGRRKEFARFPEFQDPAKRERIPDPQSPATFAASKLAWNDLRLPLHEQRLDRYRRLLAVRRTEIRPRLREIARAGEYQIIGDGAVLVRWHCSHGATLTLAANLSNVAVHFPASAGRTLWHEGPAVGGDRFGPWTVRWSLAEGAG